MRYLYFVGLLLIIWLLTISLALLESPGYLALILGLMILTGMILNYNKKEFIRDIGWGMCCAGLFVVLLFIIFLIWLYFNPFH